MLLTQIVQKVLRLSWMYLGLILPFLEQSSGHPGRIQDDSETFCTVWVYTRSDDIILKLIIDGRMNHNADRSHAGRRTLRHDSHITHKTADGIYYTLICYTSLRTHYYVFVHTRKRVFSFASLYYTYVYAYVHVILWAYYFPHRLFDSYSRIPLVPVTLANT